MEAIKGNMTQEQLSKIQAEITKLELEQKIGIDHKERLEKLYKLLE